MNKEDFNVGDYVKITKSKRNWAAQMDSYDGKIVQITKIIQDNIDDVLEIRFKDCASWHWTFDDGHFVKCDTPKTLPLIDPIDPIDQEIAFQEKMLSNWKTKQASAISETPVAYNGDIKPTVSNIVTKNRKTNFNSEIISFN